jgi:hypothetical protein
MSFSRNFQKQRRARAQKRLRQRERDHIWTASPWWVRALAWWHGIAKTRLAEMARRQTAMERRSRRERGGS